MNETEWSTTREQSKSYEYQKKNTQNKGHKEQDRIMNTLKNITVGGKYWNLDYDTKATTPSQGTREKHNP